MLLKTINAEVEWQVPDLTRNSDLIQTKLDSQVGKEGSVIFLRRPQLGQLPAPEGFMKSSSQQLPQRHSPKV